MKKNERINEIKNSIQSFKKNEYLKVELVEELEKLEEEIIEMTFNKRHIEEGNLKLWNVEKHLEDLNERLNHVADKELQDFKEKSSALINEIKKFKSGNKGERYVAKYLETLKCPNIVLQNIELSKDTHKAEIDFIVLTEKAVYILEVKNTNKNVIIDEKGNFIKIGRETLYERPIGENMNEKEYLLRDILDKMGYKSPEIKNFVVFTNSQINVENKCSFIEHTFISCLANIIYSNKDKKKYSYREMKKMANRIIESEVKQTYSPSFDVIAFKESYARLMATLEAKLKGIKYDDEVVKEEKSLRNILGKMLTGGVIATTGLMAYKYIKRCFK